MSFLEEIFGEARKHVCAALGVTELLFPVASVERERIAEVQS